MVPGEDGQDRDPGHERRREGSWVASSHGEEEEDDLGRGLEEVVEVHMQDHIHASETKTNLKLAPKQTIDNYRQVLSNNVLKIIIMFKVFNSTCH